MRQLHMDAGDDVPDAFWASCRGLIDEVVLALLIELVLRLGHVVGVVDLERLHPELLWF